MPCHHNLNNIYLALHSLKAIANEKERAVVMRGIMYMIPLAYRESCRVLAEHLRQVAALSDKNKMTLRNIELTWSLSVGQMTGAVMRVLAENPLSTPSTLQYRLPLDVAAENAARGLSDKTISVPYAVTRLVEFLTENDGFSTPMLFNTEPKNPELIEDMIYVLNGGSINGVDSAFPAETSPVDAAVALKQWIAELPGLAGVFPDSLRPDFVHAIPPIAASPSPHNSARSEGASSPSSAGSVPSANVNFSQLPDRLELLVWKLPEPYLQTIKELLSLLRNWTTFAPEDISSIQAVQALFVDYPLPLQHVLAYLLHNFESIFSEDDSALTAHLQSLVFATSPGGGGAAGGASGANGAVGIGLGPGSPLSPRHLAFNGKVHAPIPMTPVSPLSAATASPSTSNTTSASNNASGGETATAGNASNSSEPTTPEDVASTTSNPSNSTEFGADATNNANGSAPATPGSPTAKVKKAKTHKASTGTTPVSGSPSGKIKKAKEAEDDNSATLTRKTRTGAVSKVPKTADSPGSVAKRSNSPSKRSASPSKRSASPSTKGRTTEIETDDINNVTPQKSRGHLKSSSADVDSVTAKRKDGSSPGMVRSGSKTSQKGSGSKESSSDQLPIVSPVPRKPLSRSPSSTEESSNDSEANDASRPDTSVEENGNGATKSNKSGSKSASGTPSKRDKKVKTSEVSSDDNDIPVKQKADGGRERGLRRSKSSSSAGSSTITPSTSAEDVALGKKRKSSKKREDSDIGDESNQNSSEEPKTTPAAVSTPTKSSDANGSAKKKKKKDKEADADEVEKEEDDAKEPSAQSDADGMSTPKSTKKSKGEETDSTEKRKKSEKRSKSNDPSASPAAADSEPADGTNNGTSSESPKKSKKSSTASSDYIGGPSSKKASRIKVSAPLAE